MNGPSTKLYCGFHRRSIKRRRLVGKTLRNCYSFIKFVKFFHCQSFMQYSILLMAKYYTWIIIVAITVGLEDDESSVTILSWCDR